MSITKNDLVIPVSGQLLTDRFQHVILQLAGHRYGTLLMPYLGHDTDRIVGEDHDFFHLGGPSGNLTGNIDIGSQRQMIAVLFHAAKRDDTDPLGFFFGLIKLIDGQLFPKHDDSSFAVSIYSGSFNRKRTRRQLLFSSRSFPDGFGQADKFQIILQRDQVALLFPFAKQLDKVLDLMDKTLLLGILEHLYKFILSII